MVKEDITIHDAPAYYAAPKGGTHPGLVLIEEIWGLNEHIKSVADRFAEEGYVVIAPEILPQGLLEKLTPELKSGLADPKKRDAAQPKLREAMEPIRQEGYAKDAIATLKACVDKLLADERVNGNVGALGFCFGGSYSFHLAAADERVGAAVPFYGQPPSEEEIGNITCPILAFYGDQDTGLMETLPKLKREMSESGKRFDVVVYEGAGHAFFNDTNPYRYDAGAAKDAWEKATAFLKEHLS